MELDLSEYRWPLIALPPFSSWRAWAGLAMLIPQPEINL